MGKLHALLAVEPDKKGTAEKILAETINTFTKKADHFAGQLRQYAPVNDGDTELFDDEKKAMVTTVKDKLKYTEQALIELVDILYQKEETNTKARADLVLPDGCVLAANDSDFDLVFCDIDLSCDKMRMMASSTCFVRWFESNPTSYWWVAQG